MATASMDLPLRGISVLAIDDDSSTLEALTQVLELRGARVFPVRSAAGALAFGAANGLPDVVVSDVNMVGTDGLAMMTAFRRAELVADRPQTPAIAVSGCATPDDQMRALAAGYQVHLVKPINIEVLVKAIQDLAGRGECVDGAE